MKQNIRGTAPWSAVETEWAALMWRRGLSCIWIGRMLRRLPGAIYNRLERDGLAIQRATRRIRPPVLIHSNGYRLVLDGSERVYEHRIVAARMVGRPLLADEVVHHLNGDKADNRPENLEVIADNSEHMREHHRQVWSRDMDLALVAWRAEGRSIPEIAGVFGVSENSVWNRIRRLRIRHGIPVPCGRK